MAHNIYTPNLEALRKAGASPLPESLENGGMTGARRTEISHG